MMLTVHIEGVTFEGWARDLDAAYVIGPDGWSGWDDGVDVRRDETARPGAHGSFDTPGYLSARVITISGSIIARSPTQLAAMSDRLTGLIADGDKARISVQNDFGTTYADVRLASKTQVRVNGATGTDAEFQVNLWAPDMRKYGEVNSFAGSSVDVFHRGNFPAVPTITVVGPRSAPYSVSSQGRTVTVTQALTSGQTHEIDMSTGWVLRNGVLQLSVTSAADVFTIPPGVPATVTGPASMTVSVSDTYV